MSIELVEKCQNLVCVVDDDEQVNKALCILLKSHHYEVLSFKSADDFLEWFRKDEGCDLIISDINMPGYCGYDLCREVRKKETGERIPIVLITGSENEKSAGIEAGADEFTKKPFESRELFAKIDSLLAIRAAALNKTEKLGRLTRFLSPTVARMLTSDLPQILLQPHRQDVTVLFIDLRRFTRFAERFEPEEVLVVLGRYYNVVGNVALHYNGTLGHLAGDGIMVFFNDPEPIENHQEIAVHAAVAIREALAVEKVGWKEKNYDIDFGIGLAQGFATIGGIGFDRFWQYSVIGPVTNLAARLCQAADEGQILVSQRFLGRMGADHFQAKSLGTIALKGIDQSICVFNIEAIEQAESALRKIG
jgi:adenylate cyclase